MLPHQAQGAGQAIEDGAVLGTLFPAGSTQSHQVPQVLQMFQDIRYKRASTIEWLSRAQMVDRPVVHRTFLLSLPLGWDERTDKTYKQLARYGNLFSATIAWSTRDIEERPNYWFRKASLSTEESQATSPARGGVEPVGATVKTKTE
jgi:2-polyprenyl-6-methoxyphenol hydroxylase-like FAD-dependent oxidoreductase